MSRKIVTGYRMKSVFIISVLSSLLVLNGCQTSQLGDKKNAAGGALIGAVAGAVLGNQVKGSKRGRRNARFAGAALGALAGGAIGHRMDQQEKELKEKLSRTGVTVERDGQRILLRMPGKITFGSGTSSVQPNMINTLSDVAFVLNRYKNTNIEVAGHTDSKGSNSDNQLLSTQRARSVASVLKRNGVSSRRIDVAGYGESQPIASNKSVRGRAANRRVEIILSEEAH